MAWLAVVRALVSPVLWAVDGVEVPFDAFGPSTRTVFVATLLTATETDADSRVGVRMVMERSETLVMAVDGSAFPSINTRTAPLSRPNPRPEMTYPQFVGRTAVMDGFDLLVAVFVSVLAAGRGANFSDCGAAFCVAVFAGEVDFALEAGTVRERDLVVSAIGCVAVLRWVFWRSVLGGDAV